MLRKTNILILFASAWLATATLFAQTPASTLSASPTPIFDLQPIEPTALSTTWIDFFVSSTKTISVIPKEISQVPGLLAEKIDELGYALGREITVVSKDKDGVPVLRVKYISIDKYPGMPKPSIGVPFEDLGLPLSENVYEINCKTGAGQITTSTDTPLPTITTEETTFLMRECSEIGRNTLRKNTLSNLHLTESKSIKVVPKLFLFSPEIETLPTISWSFRLSQIVKPADPSAEFSVTVQVDSASEIGKLYPDYNGKLVINSKSSFLELDLKGFSKTTSLAITEKTSISSRTENRVYFRRQVL